MGKQASSVKSAPRTASKASRAKAHARTLARKWAERYTGGAILLSALLNAVASVHESGSGTWYGMGAAALTGGIVPIGVYVLCKVGANAYQSGFRRLAYIGGAVACFLLVLSLWHCSMAIAALTGSAMPLAVLLAIGIDGGLVYSEAVAVALSEVE